MHELQRRFKALPYELHRGRANYRLSALLGRWPRCREARPLVGPRSRYRRSRASVAGGCSALLQPSKGAVQGTPHLAYCAVDSLFHGRSCIGHGHGLAACEPGFQQAAHVGAARFLVAVLVAEVNFHARHLVGKAAQDVSERGTDPRPQRIGMIDVVIGIDLNEHGTCLSSGRLRRFPFRSASVPSARRPLLFPS